MAKGKRKGKKAWRSSISAKEVDDYVQKASLEERTGGPLDALPDHNLFFVDKSSDASLVKKTKKHRTKVLHCDAVLSRSSLVPPLLAPKKKIKKAVSVKAKISQQTNKKTEDKTVQDHAFDIWGEENESGKRINRKKAPSHSTAAVAVEVDEPGCSYNPRFEDHQEALGLAVAQEMEKVYQKELEPPPIPRTVPGTAIDEEDLFFLEVGEDLDENSSDEDHTQSSRPIKVKKHTRAELNKKKRRREQLRAEEESMKRANVHKDLTRINEIEKDIETEEQAKHREWLRRTVSKQEKRAQGPPRLGKLRYKPAPVQVLLSEEVSGSLRKIKGCYTVIRERYNSLQKRGIIEPRLPLKRGSRKKRIVYEEGTKGQKEREMHFAGLE